MPQLSGSGRQQPRMQPLKGESGGDPRSALQDRPRSSQADREQQQPRGGVNMVTSSPNTSSNISSHHNSSRSFHSNNSTNSGGGGSNMSYPSPTPMKSTPSDDFSMPDFSQGHSVKSHKKSKKKDKKSKKEKKERLRTLAEDKRGDSLRPPIDTGSKQDDWFDFSQRDNDLQHSTSQNGWSNGGSDGKQKSSKNRQNTNGGGWSTASSTQSFDFEQSNNSNNNAFDANFGFDNNAFAQNQTTSQSFSGDGFGASRQEFSDRSGFSNNQATKNHQSTRSGFSGGDTGSSRSGFSRGGDDGFGDKRNKNHNSQGGSEHGSNGRDRFGGADPFFNDESGKSASLMSNSTGRKDDFWSSSDDIVSGAFAEHVPTLPSDDEGPAVKFDMENMEADAKADFIMPLKDVQGENQPGAGVETRRRNSNASSISRDSLLSLTPSENMQEDDLYKSVMNFNHSQHFDLTEEEIKAKKEEVEALLTDIPIESDSTLMVETVAASMRSNEQVVEVQEVCMKYLWAYSKFNQQHQVEIIQAGLASDIILAMKKYKRSVKVQNRGCGLIWSLSVVDSNRVQMAKAGAVKCVFRALEEHIRDASLLETAFGALRTLSPQKDIRDVIQRILGPQRVCRAMALHRSSTSIQRDGCAFLSNMAVNMDRQEVSVVSREEMEAVVRALGDHLRTQSVVSSACFALRNFTYEEQNLRSLRQFDDIHSVLQDASNYSTKPEIKMDADEIRERLSILIQEDDALESIAHNSLLEAMSNPRMGVDQAVTSIRDVLKDYEWSEKLICYGLGSLLSLGRQNDAYLRRIMQFDVLRIVMHAMYKQKTSADAQTRGCELIKFLGEQGESGRSMVCDVDGCSIVISACRRHRRNDTVQLAGFEALKVLDQDIRCAKLIDRTGGLDSFKKMLEEAKLRKGISGNCLAPGAKLDEARSLPMRDL